MKKGKKQLLLFSTGLATGVALICYRRYKKELPNRLLENIKQELSVLGKIDSSWIDCTLQPYHDGEQTFKGYRGGITIIKNDQPIYYEFFVDAKSRSLITLNEVDQPKYNKV